MKTHLLLLFVLFVDGVIDAEADEEMRVMEGDDVTLHTGTVRNGNETVKWKFSVENTIIAEFDRHTKRISVDGPSKDRLEMNRQTGSLTIKNMKSKDSGLYILEIRSIQGSPSKNFRVNVTELQSVSVMEGESAIIKTDVTDIQRDDVIEWRFGDKNALIANISRAAGIFSTYDDALDERFRGRLHLDCLTGSLTISNSRTSDSGLYNLQFSCSTHTLHRRVTVSVSAPPLSPAAVVGIVVGVLLLVAAVVFGVKYLLRGEMKTVEVMEGDSAVLQIKTLRYCCCRVFHIDQWLRNNQLIYDDKRLKGRLEMDKKTGSLTIKNSRTTDSGLYQAKITICGCFSYFKMFNVDVFGEMKGDVKEGDSVTLVCNDHRIQRADEILWTAEPGDTIIAQYKRNTQEPLYTSDKRFRDRLKLKLDHQTGSLTITESRITHSGLYTLKIRSRSGETSLMRFSVFVIGEMREINVMMGDSVTLNPDVHNLQDGDKILWYYRSGRFKACIAKVTRGVENSRMYDGAYRRFRNRLNLDHQTGSLKITNTRITHSGEYRLLIISKNCSCKRFRVTVSGDVKRVPVMEGNEVTLNTETEIQRDDVIEWNYEYSLIAKMSQNNQAEYPEGEERFRGRLQLDPQTGSLTITNFTYEYTGLYEVEIKSSGKTQYKNFIVSVLAETHYMPMNEEENVSHAMTSSTVIHMPGMTEENAHRRNESDPLLNDNHEETSSF